MLEIIFGNSLFFLTSIFQISAMELTKRCLLIIPTFLAAQEKKISGQLVSQNNNKPISGVSVTTYGLKRSGLELS
jgi:hypothetical protein